MTVAKCFAQDVYLSYQNHTHTPEFSERNGIAITASALRSNCQTKDGLKAQTCIKLD